MFCINVLHIEGLDTGGTTEYVTVEIGKIRVPKAFYDWVREWCELTNTDIEDFWKAALYYSVNTLGLSLEENPLEVLLLLRKKDPGLMLV